LNVEKLLELADEYQMIELNKRCRSFLMQQRGTIEILLIAQRYQFDDVKYFNDVKFYMFKNASK
jgi:hypothetical protein